MSTVDEEALELQRQRRKRVNRMKNIIVLTIAVWMLGSFLAVIILSVCLGKLNHRVHVLEKAYLAQTAASAEQTEQPDPVITPSQEEESETSLDMEETPDYSGVVRGIDTDDNMAAEGDTHYVYLTFDCVPGKNTDAILDVLDLYQLKATFFVSGKVNEEYYETLNRIVSEGHTLGMHSYSNQYSTIYASTDAFSRDLTQISDFLYDVTGVRSDYYRFPGGSSNEISNVDMAEFVHILNSNKISYFDWNVSAGDAASNYSAEDVVANVTDGVRQYKTSVVLLHDAPDKSTTVEALTPLIDELRAMDAQILPIDENTTLIQYIKADSVE